MSTDPQLESLKPSFRLVKRRKVFRRREELLGETTDTPGLSRTDIKPSPPLDQEAEESNDGSLADVLRRRKLAKTRRGGIEFSRPATTNDKQKEMNGTASTALVPAEEKVNAVDAARNRFAPQLGTVVETNNEHMTAYIDAELARLHTHERAQKNDNKEHPPASSTTPPTNSQHQRQAQIGARHQPDPNRVPAALGQIQEIDLGQYNTTRNIALTSAATQRLSGTSPAPTSNQPQQPSRIRLGRDGKPLPRRPRKRRDSADLARDAAVEAVLRENGLGLYEAAGASSTTMSAAGANNIGHSIASPDVSGGLDATADDLIAQQFEREYLEAVQERESLRKPPPPPGPPPRPGEKVPDLARGPKLGGSRSARAAMHAREKEREKEKKMGKGR